MSSRIVGAVRYRLLEDPVGGEMSRPRYQIASDVNRDGLGMELLDDSDNVVAEVFRCDTDKTLYINTYAYDISVGDIAQLLAHAREELGCFDDGTPLSEALPMKPRRVKLKA